MADAIDGRPRNWWQWLLLYPTAGIALLTAAPQWIDRGLAVYHNTKSGSYEAAERQNALWHRNLACAAAPFDWHHNPSNVRVDATICESGDVFVRVATPDNRTFFQWVELDSVVGQPAGGISLIPQAHAATLSTPFGPATLAGRQSGARLLQAHFQGGTVICQRFLDRRRLLRHVRTPAGCFDEVVDTLNGAVVQRSRVPCRQGC